MWPRNNADFWRKKLENNAKRDAQNCENLAHLRWKVLIVWECELKKNAAGNTLKRIVQNLRD